ncbi:hypothetical protein Droror1_Dr00009619 [Drosera rotundifolia]
MPPLPSVRRIHHHRHPLSAPPPPPSTTIRHPQHHLRFPSQDLEKERRNTENLTPWRKMRSSNRRRSLQCISKNTCNLLDEVSVMLILASINPLLRRFSNPPALAPSPVSRA